MSRSTASIEPKWAILPRLEGYQRAGVIALLALAVLGLTTSGALGWSGVTRLSLWQKGLLSGSAAIPFVLAFLIGCSKQKGQGKPQQQQPLPPPPPPPLQQQPLPPPPPPPLQQQPQQLRVCSWNMGDLYNSAASHMDMRKVAAATVMRRTDGYADLQNRYEVLEKKTYENGEESDVSPLLVEANKFQTILDNHIAPFGKQYSFSQEAEDALPAGEISTNYDRLAQSALMDLCKNHDLLLLQETRYVQKKWIPEEFGSFFIEGNNNQILYRKSSLELSAHTDTFPIMDRQKRQFRGIAGVLKLVGTQRQVFCSSLHLSGCNPYFQDHTALSGDAQLNQVFQAAKRLERGQSNCLTIVGADTNTTVFHPRRKLFESNEFAVGPEYPGPTCISTNGLGVNLDVIAAKGATSIHNVDIPNIRFCDLATNPSDHRPISSVVYL